MKEFLSCSDLETIKIGSQTSNLTNSFLDTSLSVMTSVQTDIDCRPVCTYIHSAYTALVIFYKYFSYSYKYTIVLCILNTGAFIISPLLSPYTPQGRKSYSILKLFHTPQLGPMRLKGPYTPQGPLSNRLSHFTISFPTIDCNKLHNKVTIVELQGK